MPQHREGQTFVEGYGLYSFTVWKHETRGLTEYWKFMREGGRLGHQADFSAASAAGRRFVARRRSGKAEEGMSGYWGEAISYNRQGQLMFDEIRKDLVKDRPGHGPESMAVEPLQHLAVRDLIMPQPVPPQSVLRSRDPIVLAVG